MSTEIALDLGEAFARLEQNIALAGRYEDLEEALEQEGTGFLSETVTTVDGYKAGVSKISGGEVVFTVATSKMGPEALEDLLDLSQRFGKKVYASWPNVPANANLPLIVEPQFDLERLERRFEVIERDRAMPNVRR